MSLPNSEAELEKLKRTIVRKVIPITTKRKFLVSIDNIRRHGTYISGDEAYDRGIDNSSVLAYLHGFEIARKMEMGADITFNNWEDAKELYERFQQYLHLSVHQDNNDPLNHRNRIDNNFELAESCSARLFELLRYHYHLNKQATSFVDKFETIVNDMMGLTKPKEKLVEEKDLPKRRSFETLVKRHRLGKPLVDY